MYEVFEHTADLGLRIEAATWEQLLREAATGMFSMIVANISDVQPVQERKFELQSDAADYLLFDWLNELLFIFDTEKLLLVEFDVAASETELTACVRGEFLDAQRHQLEHEVKAITYHGLAVGRTNAAWQAEVIVDI